LGAEPFIKMMAAVKIGAVPGPVAFDDMGNPIQNIYIKRAEKKKLFGYDKRVSDDRSNTNVGKIPRRRSTGNTGSPPSDSTKPRRKGRKCV
jgi:hypothetical protein